MQCLFYLWNTIELFVYYYLNIIEDVDFSNLENIEVLTSCYQRKLSAEAISRCASTRCACILRASACSSSPRKAPPNLKT